MGCTHSIMMRAVLLLWFLIATVGRMRPSSSSLLMSGGKRTKSIHKKGNKRMVDSHMPRTSVNRNRRKRKGGNSDKGKTKVCDDDHDEVVPVDEEESATLASQGPGSKETNKSVRNSSGTPVIQRPSASFNVTCLTWNMAELSPTEEDCSFMKSFRSSDMVVLGVQECEDIKPRRHEGN